MLHIHTILYPTDFSDASMHALHLARSLARDHGAKLMILAVAMPLTPVSEFYASVGEMDEQIADLNQQLGKLTANISDVRVESRTMEDDPGHAIVSIADDIAADLIVMGTHGRTGLSRLLMGSVAEHVMRHAHCPVLTVKPGPQERVPTEESENADEAGLVGTPAK